MKRFKLSNGATEAATAVAVAVEKAPAVPEPTQPPLPSQMTRPVGPPPAPVTAPSTYDEFVTAALKARGGRMDMAQLWAQLAQADATNRAVTQLQRLNRFFGVDDVLSEDPVTDEPRLYAVIADGVTSATITIQESSDAES